MIRWLASTVLVALLVACTSDSKAPTSESWVQVTPQQAVAAIAPRIDVYTEQEDRTPQMKNGCATDVIKDGDVVLINRVHRREVYCIGIAPLRITTIELPAGTQLTGIQAGMMEWLAISDADAGGRHIISIQSRCLPLTKDQNGKPFASDTRKLMPDQGSMPYCPRASSDMVILTSDGPISLSLFFNETGRTRVVDIRNDPKLTGHSPRIPHKKRDARDLYAMPVDDVDVPWAPDDAWYTPNETVIVWHRPMPTLPSLHIGKDGEMMATAPVVINEAEAIAMIYPRVLTEFQLRMDDRAVQFSARPLRAAANQRETLWE